MTHIMRAFAQSYDRLPLTPASFSSTRRAFSDCPLCNIIRASSSSSLSSSTRREFSTTNGTSTSRSERGKSYTFAVIGGGPCGIAAVGGLVDKPEIAKVVWIDAANFKVGRMGENYRFLPANTPNDSVQSAFDAVDAWSFRESQRRRGDGGVDGKSSSICENTCKNIEHEGEDIVREIVNRTVSGQLAEELRQEGKGIEASRKEFPSEHSVHVCSIEHSCHVRVGDWDLARKPMVDFPDQVCLDLVYLVDSLEDATEKLKNLDRVKTIHGVVRDINAAGETLKHEVNVGKDSFEVDGVILATGAVPCAPVCFAKEFGLRGVTVLSEANALETKLIGSGREYPVTLHPVSMDEVVSLNNCERFIKGVSKRHQHQQNLFCLIGGSHTGMVVLYHFLENLSMNSADVRFITRSPDLKFAVEKMDPETGEIFRKYPGTGLKGPVGDWVKEKVDLVSLPEVKKDCASDEKRYKIGRVIRDDAKSWEEQILDGFRDRIANTTNENHTNIHLILATGFKTVVPDISVVTAEIDHAKSIDATSYNKSTGEINHAGGGIFGTGIGWPLSYTDPEGHSDPWVGFGRSVLHTRTILWETFLRNRGG